MYADKTIRCRDCGMDFVFSAGEQEQQRDRQIGEDDVEDPQGHGPGYFGASRWTASTTADVERPSRKLSTSTVPPFSRT